MSAELNSFHASLATYRRLVLGPEVVAWPLYFNSQNTKRRSVRVDNEIISIVSCVEQITEAAVFSNTSLWLILALGARL